VYKVQVLSHREVHPSVLVYSIDVFHINYSFGIMKMMGYTNPVS